ncbi:integrin alpha-2 isoform X2 [Ictalurus punctatus]|uniref:Integrin alpha-2 isoform X2 n=1 Tax=Ictalurus punctatus TaxID=7998 RepID=A0A9F7TMG5_ICTPU|nr:integrin alpha-2 isoform X2 [Ictalurus punctatus]
MGQRKRVLLPVLLLLLILQGWCIEHTRGFNVGTSGAKIFSGPTVDEFGYTVQQFSNHQGKWLLVGAPWTGYTQNRKGDVYKCAIEGPTTTCDKLNLQNGVNIPNVQNINVNMSLGLTLIRTTKNAGFMTCGPLWAQGCGSQYFYPGVCAEVSPLFVPQPAFSPALQTCGGPMDIAIVLDGSNSIYPWPPVVEFLKKLLGHLDIGPQQSQVSIIQYGVDPKMEFKLNAYKTRASIVQAASAIPQRGGIETNTFRAIEYARVNAFLPANGGRPGASKVMVVVTDGESHDNSRRNTVIPACEKDGITRFGIAVLGYYIRNNIDSKKLVEEIKSIASNPADKYYFNVSAEEALLEIAGTLGDRIFNIEGTGTGGEFQMELSQVGFSAHQTKNQDVMMLGAVGAYGWTGTVVHKTAQTSEIFPKGAFEQILEDKNHSSLLGYSVSTLYSGSTEYFVAGAPRSNHTGQVVVYTLNKRRQPDIRHSQRGDQIGSYFGSVLCPLDVDRDGVTDLLLVGAPMYMSDAKKEMGKVYIFTVTDGFLSSQGFLEGSSRLENARFGMAISAASDLNLDGLTDVVVGAPLEENGQGAVYIYNGDARSIRKQSSQKILAVKLDPTLRYFGRSLDAAGDLNGDSVPDVSVGSYGKVLQLWSRGVAVVTARVTFTPDMINIESKPCSFSGRKVSCFIAKVCFSAAFKPTTPVGPAEIKYNMTLDADLRSSRFSSRGQFGNSERVVQQNVGVSTAETCEEHQVYVQDTPDLESIAVRVDIGLQQPDSSPVLDAFSPSAWEFFIPFIKDCGGDDMCYSDLVLSVEREPPSSLLLVSKNNRLSLSVTVMNRKENAYNTRVIARFSSNLFYSSVTPPSDDTEVKCTSSKDTEIVTCQVGYPALRTDQLVTFEINFDFNLARLQKEVKVAFEAQSDSKEETPADNSETMAIPIQYRTEIILSREANMNVYLLDEKDEITNPIKTYSDIGPELKFNLKVSGAVFPVSLVYLDVSLPVSTKSGNHLLYVTSVESTPSDVQCETQALIDPFKIRDKEYTATFTKESFRGTSHLNCDSAVCKQLKCVLKDLSVKSDYYISVSARIWNGTFAEADFQSVVLDVNAQIETSQSDLLVIAHKQVTVDVTVSKPGAKADVPVGVIVGSVIGGLLLLAVAVAVLWKLGFFKRKYQQLQRGDDGAEAEGLQDNAGQQ